MLRELIQKTSLRLSCSGIEARGLTALILAVTLAVMLWRGW